MEGILNRFLSEDHDRLDALMAAAVAAPEAIEPESFAAFRQGLLHHIAMEERVVLPAIARLSGGVPLPIADRLHVDHGALAALLVPSPSRSIIATIRSILHVHNALEEQEGGLYHVLDQLTGTDARAMLDQLKAVPAVPLQPHHDGPGVLDATRRAVQRAGHRFVDVPQG